MNYGFHLATAGAITGMRRLDTVANNLANATTVGFKADTLSISARLPENLEKPGMYADTNAMLDALGGGTLFHPNSVDTRQGTILQTNQPLDLAIEGDGYFVLAQPKGAPQRDLLLTRAGALARNSDGLLAQVGSGVPILGEDGQPIALENGAAVKIETDGRVTQNGNDIGRLRVVVPSDPTALVKEGRDALRLLGGGATPAPESTRVVQGSLEQSTVDAVTSLAELIRVSRGIEFSTRLMQMQDQMTGRLIDTFGRFA